MRLHQKGLQWLTSLLIIHWVLLPYYEAVWSFIVRVSWVFWASQEALNNNGVRVWLSILLGMVIGSLPLIICYSVATANQSKNKLPMLPLALPR